MSTRQYSLFDRLLVQGGQALRTLAAGAAQAARPSPAQHLRSDTIDDAQRQHVAGLMRSNHTGEVCAQAPYQGQALTARLPDIRVQMEQAAAEEVDHLTWCEQRLNDLRRHTSEWKPAVHATPN